MNGNPRLGSDPPLHLQEKSHGRKSPSGRLVGARPVGSRDMNGNPLEFRRRKAWRPGTGRWVEGGQTGWPFGESGTSVEAVNSHHTVRLVGVVHRKPSPR